MGNNNLTDKNTYKYINYNDYWQNSFQRLDGLAKDLEKDFHTLEKKYYDFDKIYNELITNIGIISSIYSSHNNLKGLEYILRLKAVLNAYKKKYTHRGIDFKTIHFLYAKINKLRDQSFEEFPKMDHSNIAHGDLDIGVDNSEIRRDIQRYNELKRSAKFKWITYSRNGSWFISPCGEFQIIELGKADILPGKDLKIKFGNTILPVMDLFSQFKLRRQEEINYFILVKNDNLLKCFTANKLNKIIMADTDLISTRLKPIIKSKIASGRIRLFGKNHLYLK